MQPFQNTHVAQKFASYPANVRKKLLHLRTLIFKTAAITPGVGPIEETLKWGEPAYLTSISKSGSTIRMDWKAKQPEHYALYFHCQTNLITTFRTLFPKELTFVGNRSIIFNKDEIIPVAAIQLCIATALTYHLTRK